MVTYARNGNEVDVAIEDIPFRLATSTELPQSIETIPVRKDQFDAERDPGEQSLSGYWRRSQASFHHGAGFLYEGDASSEGAFAGFHDSSGVDVFTPGRVTLQRAMELQTGTGTTDFTRLVVSNGNTYAVTRTGELWMLSSTGTSASLTHDNATIDIMDALWATGGETAYIYGYTTMGQGRLIAIDSSDGTEITYKIVGGNTGVPRMMRAKHRLWIINAHQIFQPQFPGGGVSDPAIYTHPEDNFVYTCLADGPTAVYFGGHDGSQSSIQSITLDESGGLPTLSGATIAAVLPIGELITSMQVLAGQYMGIGTNQGFRVGRIEANGTITYGPLILAKDPDSTANYYGVTDVGVSPRSFVVAVRDAGQAACAYEVHVEQEIAPLVFPYQRVAEISGAAVGTYYNSVVVHMADGLVPRIAGVLYDSTGTATPDPRIYRQSRTNYVASGWIETSRIRYYTTERKSFKSLDLGVGSLPTGSTVTATITTDKGVTQQVAVVDELADVDTGFPLELAAARYVSVTLTLARASGTTTSPGPRLESFLLKALPSVIPQRLITLPLLCFDYEQARSGQRYGGEGYAAERLAALQAYEDSTTTVEYQNFWEANGTPVPCVIESIRFTQLSAPLANRQEGAGGILLLQLRTVSL
jgi:hypothetical protein